MLPPMFRLAVPCFAWAVMASDCGEGRCEQTADLASLMQLGKLGKEKAPRTSARFAPFPLVSHDITKVLSWLAPFGGVPGPVENFLEGAESDFQRLLISP
ncbi:unnamed protein product [Polarella glacialis]|uniref:Uncharacterized protein n=1 Tax=Polarella glacialis TaxID=89957 RepID=A0A813IM67_POLGL|nr:unnamed protein product [Polarella glacialis]